MHAIHRCIFIYKFRFHERNALEEWERRKKSGQRNFIKVKWWHRCTVHSYLTFRSLSGAIFISKLTIDMHVYFRMHGNS